MIKEHINLESVVYFGLWRGYNDLVDRAYKKQLELIVARTNLQAINPTF